MSYGLAAPLTASSPAAAGWQAYGGSPSSQSAATPNSGLGSDSATPNFGAAREVPLVIPAVQPQDGGGLSMSGTSTAGAQNRGTLAVAITALIVSGMAFLAIPIIRSAMGSGDKAAHNLHMEQNVRNVLHVMTQSGKDPGGLSAQEYLKNFAIGETLRFLTEEIRDEENALISARKAEIEEELRARALPSDVVARKTRTKLFAEFAHPSTESASHERIRKTAQHLQAVLSNQKGIDDIRRAIDAAIEHVGVDKLGKLAGVPSLEHGRAQHVLDWLTETHAKAVEHVRKPMLKKLGVIR